MDSNEIKKKDQEVLDEVLSSGDGIEAKAVKKHHTKRNVIIIVCVLLVVAILGTTFGIMFTRKPDNIIDYGFQTIDLELPTDGSDPTQHEGYENIGYMNHKLKSQPYYYATANGTIDNTAGVNQTFTSYKQNHNGATINTEIATSSLVNSCVQTCATDDWVVWRNAAGGKSSYSGLDTVFSTTPAGSCSVADYRTQWGFPPSEFSVYVLNEKTIDHADPAVDNGDGTYTQTFYLNINTDDGYENQERSAVYYYKQHMVATGGLTEFPTFSYSTLTYTFDSEWQILELDVNEVYKTVLGPVATTCTANSTTVYTYGNESLCINDAYDNFFSAYIGQNVDYEASVSISDCLAQAFGSVLTEPVTFSLDMAVDGQDQPISGLLYLDINDMDIRADLANIKLYMEEESDPIYYEAVLDDDGNEVLDDDGNVTYTYNGPLWLYLAYGDETKIKLDVNALDTSGFSAGLWSTVLGSGSGFDTDALLEELADGTFVVSEDGTSATLDSVINLLGLEIPVHMSFNIATDEDTGAKTITLGDMSATLSLWGMDMDIAVNFSDQTVATLTTEQKAQYMDTDDNINGLLNLVSMMFSQETQLDLSYATDSFSVELLLQMDLTKSLIHLEIDLDFGNGSAVKYIGVDYNDAEIYLTLDSADMNPLKIKTNLGEAINIVTEFIEATSSSSTSTASIATASAYALVSDNAAEQAATSITDIISSFSNFSFSDFLYSLLADSDFANAFYITQEGKFEIDTDTVLEMSGVGNVNLGTLTFVAGETSFYLDDGPFELSIVHSEGEITAVDATEYADAESFITIMEELENLIVGKSVGLTGSIDVEYEGTTVAVSIDNLTVSWADGITVYLEIEFTLGGKTQDIYVLYTGSTNTLQLAYGSVGLELSFETGSGTDLEKLENALVAAYDKIAGIANYYLAEGSQWTQDAQSLNDILAGFGVAIETTESATDIISEIIDLFSSSDTDSGSIDIWSLLADLSFGMATDEEHAGWFEMKIAGVDVLLKDVSTNHDSTTESHNEPFTIDIDISYESDSFSLYLPDWEVGAGTIGTIPASTKYVTADKLVVLINSITATADILTGTTEIYFEYDYTDEYENTVALSADVLFSLQNSNASGTITARIYDTDSYTKTLEFSYEDGMFYMSLYSADAAESPYRIKADISEAVNVITGYFSTSATVSDDPEADDSAADETVSIIATIISFLDSQSFASVMDGLFTDGGFFDILSATDSSTWKLDIGGLCGILGVETDLGDAYVSMGTDGIILDLSDAYGVSLSISGTEKSVTVNKDSYTDAYDLIDLLNGIQEIIDAQSVGLTGSIVVSDVVTEGDTSSIDVSIDNLTVSWADGISVYMAASFCLNNETQNIYVLYTGSTNTLQLAYGEVGLELNFDSGDSSDLAKLEASLVAAYDKIAEIANFYLDAGSQWPSDAQSLQDVLTGFGVAINLSGSLTDIISDIINLFSGSDTDTDSSAAGNATENTSNSVMDIFSDMYIGAGADGGLELQIAGVTVDLQDITTAPDGAFTFEVNLSYASDSISLDLNNWDITTGSVGTMPSGAEYVTADDLAALIDCITATADILTGTTEIDISYDYGDDVSVEATILFSLENSDASGTITATFYNDSATTKTIGFYYADGTFYLSLYSADNSAAPYLAKGSVSDAITLIESFFSSDDTDADDGAGEAAEATASVIATIVSILDNETLASVMGKLFGDGDFFEIFSTDNQTGTFKIDIAAICELFGVDESTLESLGNVTFTMDGEGISAELSGYGVSMDIIKSESAVAAAPTGDYADAEDLIELIDGIMDIVDAQSVSLSGTIAVDVSGTTIFLDIQESTIDWSNGINVYVHTYIGVNDTVQELYLSYESNDQTLMLAYGTVGIKLSLKSGSDDIQAIKDALADADSRLTALIQGLFTNGYFDDAQSLSDILDTIQQSELYTELLDLLSDLFSSSDSDDSGTSDESSSSSFSFTAADIIDMVSKASMGAGTNGGFGLSLESLSIGSVDLSNLSLEIVDVSKDHDNQFNLSVSLGGSISGVDIALSDITAKVGDSGYQMPSATDVNYLTGTEFGYMIDYLVSAAELISEHSITVEISGTQYDYNPEYTDYRNVKYNISATFAIEWGTDEAAEADPDDTNETDTDEAAANPFYMYASVVMEAPNPDDDSYVIGLYIMDRNYDGTTDGDLDIYLSISNKETTSKDYSPLMFYVPGSEIMSLVSMGLAACDLGSLTISNETLQAILSAVAEYVQDLMDNYLSATTQAQFASLGSWIFSMIADGGLQGLIDNLLGATSTDDTEDSEYALTVADIEYESGAAAFSLTDPYIKALTITDTQFQLVLNALSMYGEDATEGDLTVTVTRDNNKNLASASISNVYYNDMESMMALSMDFTKSVTRVTDLESGDEGYVDFSAYWDWSGLDAMVEMLVNSVMSTSGEEGCTDYSLANNFYFAGSMTVDLMSIYSLTLNIDGLSLNISDDFSSFSLDAQISYSQNTLVFKADTTLNLSIRNDMVYMRRTASGSSEYRIMSMTAFVDDIINQLEWMLNLRSLVANIITSVVNSISGSGSDPVDMSGYDYGALVAGYLDKYTYSVDGSGANNWYLKLNGDTISGLAGMSLSDLTATFISDADDATAWSSLLVTGSISGVVELDVTLDYIMPGDVDTFEIPDTLYDIGIYEGLTWDDILGGTTFDEICGNIDWDQMTSDLGTTYLDYTGSGNLRVGLAEFYFSDEDQATTFLGSQYVLYNSSKQNIYTILDYPDISEYDREDEDLKAVWTSTSFDTTNNIITITATREITYTVTVMGCEYGDETSQNVIQHVYESTYLAKDADTLVQATDGNWYMISYYADADGNNLNLSAGLDSSGNECYILPVTEDITVYAHWEQAYGVTFIDSEECTEETLYYYAGTTLTEDNMLAIPVRRGYTVTWQTEDGDTSYDVAASGNKPFYAVYTINHYNITFASELEVAETSQNNGSQFVYNEDTGYYEYTISLEYGTELSLSNEELVTQLAIVNGWTYGGKSYGDGATVTVVDDDMTFYVDFEYKTITVHYYYNTDSKYNMTVITGSDGNYTLLDPGWEMYSYDGDAATKLINPYIFLGWAYEVVDENGYTTWDTITDVSDLVLVGETSLSVYAIIIEIPELTLTATKSSSGGFLGIGVTYTYSGTLTATEVKLVGYFANIGILSYDTESIDIEYYYNNDGNLIGNGNSLGAGTTIECSTDDEGKTILTDSFSFSESNSKSDVLAWFTVNYTITIGSNISISDSCTSTIAAAV
ncbi:MAG: hypothetical protein LUD51_01185 [Clostridia bacterium]|nr:hypothetical protein [Clostridia bacterium]